MKSRNRPIRKEQGSFWRRHRLIVLFAVILFFSVTVCSAGYGLFTYFFNQNPVEEVAQPLSKSLAVGGAIKKCSNTYDGKEGDNRAPWYEGRYLFEGSKDDAVKLISKAAQSNGYKLVHLDSPYDYVEWYRDDIGKQNPYPGLRSGNIKISFDVDSAGKLYCSKFGPTGIKYDSFDLGDRRIGITLNVNFPEYR